jgi:hypothetical protein
MKHSQGTYGILASQCNLRITPSLSIRNKGKNVSAGTQVPNTQYGDVTVMVMGAGIDHLLSETQKSVELLEMDPQFLLIPL